MGRLASAVAVSTIGFTALTFSPASATTNSGLTCVATLMDNHLSSYSMVTINVRTKPRAEVSGTESAAAHSWSMAATAPANAAGIARLYQKVSGVSRYEVVRVTVSVTLNGTTGHCTTHYTPPRLTPINF
jgi:hypothetical protein